MTAWGRTGRVEIECDDPTKPGATADVILDGGERVGWIGYPADDPWWAVLYAHPGKFNLDLPSLDAAVMWVLRRAAPDVWREERPAVARVDLTAGGWRVDCGDPEHQPRWLGDREMAFAAAHRASASHARWVAP